MKQTFKFLILFLLTLLGTSMNLWAAKYYYRGAWDDNWAAKEMNLSTDGLYYYWYTYASNDNRLFKITDGTEWTTAYGYTYNDPGFNGTDITNMNKTGNTWNVSDNNCAVNYKDGRYYILIYLPNTPINATNDPKICASTTLPEDKFYLVGDFNNWNTTAGTELPLGSEVTISSLTEGGAKVVRRKSWDNPYGAYKENYELEPGSSAYGMTQGASESANFTFAVTYTNAKFKLTYNTSDKKMYLQFVSATAPSYNINYKDKGGSDFSGSHETNYPTTHTYGTATTLKTASKTGYTFGGWFKNSDCSDAAVTTLGAKDYTADITLYAKWTANTYTVTFDNKGATTAGTASVTATYDAAMPSATMPTKTGYNFDGYYDTDGSSSGNWGTQYYTNTGASARNWDKTSNTTLYAKWTEKTWTVSATYGTGGASATVTTSPAGQVTGTAISATAADGYIFSGWTITEGDGSFADAKSASTTYYPTSASELKATFARSTVTVNSGISGHATLSGSSTSHDVTIGTDTNVPGDEDVTFTVSNLENGYKIEGWYTNSTYTEGKHDAGVDTYVLSSTNPNKNVYVKITPITYTITYNLDGGTNYQDAPETYNIETATIDLGTPTKTNYTFMGWYLNSGFTGDAVTTIPTGSTGNKEYWAKWEETKHTVTLVNAKTGSSVQVGNVTPVTITANDPTLGYYFTGWTASDNTKVTFASASSATTTIKATGDVTVTANFAERFYLRGSVTASGEAPGGMPGWNDDAKDSGKGLFTTIDGNTATITKTLEAATEYKLKLGDLQGDCSWGGDYEFTNDEFWTFSSNESNCSAPTFRTSIAGTYTFTIDFSEASPKMKITYPAVPDFTLSVAEARVYEETPMANFIAGNGTEENPYQFYLDEKMTLTVTALSPVTGVTAYYKFGDDAESSTVLTKDITAANTTVQSIVVKTYYKGNIGSYTSAEKTETIYYQGVAVPALHLHSSLTNDEVEKSLAPNDVTIFYTTENYTGAATITKNNETWETVESGSQWQQTETLDKTIHSDTYVATASPNERTFTATLAVSVYRYVQVKVEDADPKWAKNVYMWKSGTDKKNAEWPGEALTTQLGDWYIFAVKYPTYDKFVVNDGKTTGKQTIDLDIPAADICYAIGTKKEDKDSKQIYNCTTGDCPNGLYVGDIADVEMFNGESATASPVVQLDPTLDEKNLNISFSYSNSGIVTATQSGTKIMLSANQAGTTTVTATYSIEGAEDVSKTFTVTVKGAVMIQAKYGDLGWTDGQQIYIRYWGNGVTTTATKMTWKEYVDGINKVYARIPLGSDNQINFQIYAWNMDNDKQWHITKDVNGVTTSGCYNITPDPDCTNGCKRNITRDGDNCWAEYQVKIVMNNGTIYTSNTISNTEETLSFFAPGEHATGYNRGDVYLMCNGSQKAVIPSSTFATSGVYTAKTDGSTLTDVALYTGNYYIRTDGASGGWDHYKEADKDNKFVKFDAIETSTYDHYWVKNIKPAKEGDKVNLQACVGNDYNENLANKIEASNYTDEYGSVTPDDKGVNLRFGYSPLTNNFERAIIKGSSTNEFLNVIGNNVYKERECTTLLNTQSEDSKFADKEQWIYEKTVYVKIDGTHISAEANLQSKDYNGNVMYQLGYEIDPITGKSTSTPKTFGLIAAGTTYGTYAIKLVYDFKTNRMVSGWTPSENPIEGTIVLDADILLVRKHQESAAQIKFVDNTASIKQIHHIYGVLTIEKNQMLNATNADYAKTMYWISFPFNVKISEIFGVDGYGQKWIMQRYNGEKRAKIGWFKGDGTETFWEFMDASETLKAYEGYLFLIDANYFNTDGADVWKNSATEANFYFPSASGNIGIINQSSFTQPVSAHKCSIDREFTIGKNDQGEDIMVNHMNTDSYWNVIGVPAFQNTTAGATPISGGLNAYYEWIPSNNTYKAETVNLGGVTFKTMHAYMVQFGGTLTWSNVSVVSKAPYAYADNKNYMIELFFNGNDAEDHTYIKLADEASTDFVLNEDMMKIDNAGFPNIYSFAGNYNVAYNETKKDNQTVMLGVSAPKDGNYTFAMPKDFSGTAKLVDLVEGITTDLNVANYSVDLNKGIYNNRFQLVLEVEAKTPTSIEADGQRGREADGKTTKLLRNGEIYLINGGRVYNVLGVEE